MGSYFSCLGKYATFSGRSRRREFWGYTIVNAIILGIMIYFYLTAKTDASQSLSTAVLIIYILITICPTLAVTARRWHDLGRTGKWLWLNLVPAVGTVVTLCFMLGEGEADTNEYGRNPKERKIRRRR